MKTPGAARVASPESGFTLVELMIVVAIIGILSSIAIPNYQRYQAKSRTTEGKIQLATAYTAERSFFIEYGSYTGCLGAAGYAPDLGSNTHQNYRYYAVGVSLAAVTATSCGTVGNLACNGAWSNGNPTCANLDGTSGGNPPAVTNATYWSANRATFPGSTAAQATQSNFSAGAISSTTFVLEAAGNINATTNTVYDQWTITDGRVITQVAVGY
jgi:type IV pilus assembly protein PilA